MKSITNNVAKGQSTKSYESLVRNPYPNKQTTHTWWIKQTTSMNKKSINESIEKRVRKDLFTIIQISRWNSENWGWIAYESALENLIRSMMSRKELD